MINRPYFSYGIVQLQELFSNSKSDLRILKSIQYELSHREKPKARALKQEVDLLITQLSSNSPTVVTRPYFRYGIDQLQELFSNSKTDFEMLSAIQYELTFRERPKARALKEEIDQLIQRPKSKTHVTKPEVPNRIVIECAYCKNANFVTTIEDTVQNLSCNSCGQLYEVSFKYGVVRTLFHPLKDTSNQSDPSFNWLIFIGIFMVIIILAFISK